jgi:RecB family exonuclease
MVKRMLKEIVSPYLPMGWLTRLIAGAIIAALFAWGGQWVAHVEGSVVKINTVEVQQREQHVSIDQRVSEIRGSLDRIETKLDRVIDREIGRDKGK